MKRQLISFALVLAMFLSIFPCGCYAANDSAGALLFTNAVNYEASFNFDANHLTVGKIYDDIFQLNINGELKQISELDLSNDKISIEDDSIAEVLYVAGEYDVSAGGPPPYLQLLAKKIGNTKILLTIGSDIYELNINITEVAEEDAMIYMTPFIYMNNWTFAKQDMEIDYYTGYHYMDAHYIGDRYCFVDKGVTEISFVTIEEITSSSESAIYIDHESGNDDVVYFKGVGFGSSIISLKDTLGNIHKVELMVKLPDELKDTSEGIIYITNLNNGHVASYTKMITLNECSGFKNSNGNVLTIQCFYYYQGLYKPLIPIDGIASITYSAFVVEYDKLGKFVSVDVNAHSIENPLILNKNNTYKLIVTDKMFAPW